MLDGLLRVLQNDASFSLGRNAKKGLKGIESLGDLSAHNRRFNVRKADIDKVRDGLRVFVEELLHLARFT